MSRSFRRASPFARALVRSAAADAPPRGAAARARARLGVDDGSTPSPLGIVGALLLAAVTCATAWSPGPGAASRATVFTAEAPDCSSGIEAPPRVCGAAAKTASAHGPIAGSSSGAFPMARGGSGG